MKNRTDIKNELLNRTIPEEFIEEWTKSVAEPKVEPKQNEISVAYFILNGSFFALASDIFVETQPYRDFHAIPFRSGNFLKGLVNVNGELLLFIDISAILGVYGDNSNKSKKTLSVISDGKDKYCFIADSFEGVIQIPEAELSDAPVTVKGVANAVTKATFVYSENTVNLIDENKIFDKLNKVIKW